LKIYYDETHASTESGGSHGMAHGHEQPTIDKALDSYYRNCWDQPDRFGKQYDSSAEGSGHWYRVKELDAIYSDTKHRFVLVGRRTPNSGWIVISEGTGP